MHEFLHLNAAFGTRIIQRQKSPFMVRLPRDMRRDVESVAKANGLTMSDIVRLACRMELPAIKAKPALLTSDS
jgi:antitoxin component of RelBE/YafQ-DinJ toxin-antitoxin module